MKRQLTILIHYNYKNILGSSIKPVLNSFFLFSSKIIAIMIKPPIISLLGFGLFISSIAYLLTTVFSFPSYGYLVLMQTHLSFFICFPVLFYFICLLLGFIGFIFKFGLQKIQGIILFQEFILKVWVLVFLIEVFLNNFANFHGIISFFINSSLFYDGASGQTRIWFSVVCFIILVLFYFETLTNGLKKIEYAFLLNLLLGLFFFSTFIFTLPVFFLFLELVTLLLVILFIGVVGKRYLDTIKAIIQFFIINASYSTFILFGLNIILFVSSEDVGGFSGWFFLVLEKLLYSEYTGVYSIETVRVLKIGLLFIFITFVFKITLIPFASWIIQVYRQLPLLFVIILLTIYKLAIIHIFLKFMILQVGQFPELFNDFIRLSYYIILPSIFTGCFAFRQKDLKTIFSLLTISQIGVVFSGLIINNIEGLSAAVLYLYIYIFQIVAVFVILLCLKTFINITSSEQLFIVKYYNKAYYYFLILLLFSIAGVPPLGGFYYKYVIFISLFLDGYYLFAIAGLISGFLIAVVYLDIVIGLLQVKESQESQEGLVHSLKNAGRIAHTNKAIFYYRVLNIIIWLGIAFFVIFTFFFFNAIFTQFLSWSWVFFAGTFTFFSFFEITPAGTIDNYRFPRICDVGVGLVDWDLIIYILDPEIAVITETQIEVMLDRELTSLTPVHISALRPSRFYLLDWLLSLWDFKVFYWVSHVWGGFWGVDIENSPNRAIFSSNVGIDACYPVAGSKIWVDIRNPNEFIWDPFVIGSMTEHYADYYHNLCASDNYYRSRKGGNSHGLLQFIGANSRIFSAEVRHEKNWISNLYNTIRVIDSKSIDGGDPTILDLGLIKR